MRTRPRARTAPARGRDRRRTCCLRRMPRIAARRCSSRRDPSTIRGTGRRRCGVIRCPPPASCPGGGRSCSTPGWSIRRRARRSPTGRGSRTRRSRRPWGSPPGDTPSATRGARTARPPARRTRDRSNAASGCGPRVCTAHGTGSGVQSTSAICSPLIGGPAPKIAKIARRAPGGCYGAPRWGKMKRTTYLLTSAAVVVGLTASACGGSSESTATKTETVTETRRRRRRQRLRVPPP